MACVSHPAKYVGGLRSFTDYSQSPPLLAAMSYPDQRAFFLYGLPIQQVVVSELQGFTATEIWIMPMLRSPA